MRGNGFFIEVLVGMAIFFWGVLQAQTPPPPPISPLGIVVTHDQYYCVEAPIPIVSSVEITDDNPVIGTLNEVFIQISEGYEFGQDLLTYSGIISGITSSWSPSEGVLTLSGTAPYEDYETAIENVFFQTNQTIYSTNRAISINLGTASFLPSTGHYYRYVSAPGISWSQARDQAAAETYFGLQGYLVTITSQEEAQLAGEQSPGTGWIGGSDQEEEGIWKWVTGPEAGSVFWEGQFNGSAPPGAFAFWNCAEPNNFGGDEDYAHITDNSVAGCGGAVDPDFIGSWNDLPIDSGSSDPSNPYYPRGYIVEFGGFPDESEIFLSASSVINLPMVNLENQAACGSETFEINLDGNADDYYWYEDPVTTTEFFIGDSYTVSLTQSETYWISPRFSGCSSGGREPLMITVNELPEAFDQTIIQCDSEGDTDGITEFNLSTYDDLVAGGDLTNRSVFHFEDSGLSIPISSSSYTNLFNGQVVYAQVINNLTTCSNVAEIELQVTVPDSNTAYLEECDELPEDGFTLFDLSQADEQVIADPNSGITTSYYETYNDALLQVNQLPLNFVNTVPNFQIIYVRLQEGNSCFGINEVELMVKPLPQLEPDETVYYCLNTFPEPILIDGGIINDIPNNYYYQWSTGETTIAIEVNEPGTYTVEVTEVFGCTNMRTINVLPSETAVVENVQVETSSDLSTVSVQVSGTGDYEFALDNEFGPYQQSNVFENISAGVKTVFIRDVKGECGIVSEEISVIGYPRFFTPNDDGQNDFWSVKGFNSRIPFIGVVRIFNRDGKQLAELSTSNPFWDGTYNGNKMPSSDYWFIAELDDGQTFTGHFSLKR